MRSRSWAGGAVLRASRAQGALVTVAAMAGCAVSPVVDGPVGVRPGTATLMLSGSVPDDFEPTFWTTYVATRSARGCTRIDGESGRVRRTVRHRYPLRIESGRYRVDILLDPGDRDECGFAPESVHFTAVDRRTGLRTDAYLPVVALDADAGTRTRAVVFECQGWPLVSPASLGCSLPRVQVAPGVLCSRPEPVHCVAGCEVTADFRRVEPPRAEALWAVPPGCG